MTRANVQDGNCPRRVLAFGPEAKARGGPLGFSRVYTCKDKEDLLKK